MKKSVFLSRYSFKRFLLTRQGVAAIEFALSLPFLVMLSFGAVEVTRYVLITQKLERVSISLSDIVAQSETISSSQLNQIIGAAGQVMLPYDFNANGYAIISSVSKTGINQPVVNWQYKSAGAARASHIGVAGGVAAMPSGFTMLDKDTVIIAEVFFNYIPILSGIIYNSREMYRYSIYKPRLGKLTTLSGVLPDSIKFILSGKEIKGALCLA